MSKKRQILKHIDNLKTIYPEMPAATMEADILYLKLRVLERRANALAVRVCNQPVAEEVRERVKNEITEALDALLGFSKHGPKPLINCGDPRGHALKIEDADVRKLNLSIERDWGGYGIIAPEF